MSPERSNSLRLSAIRSLPKDVHHFTYNKSVPPEREGQDLLANQLRDLYAHCFPKSREPLVLNGLWAHKKYGVLELQRAHVTDRNGITDVGITYARVHTDNTIWTAKRQLTSDEALSGRVDFSTKYIDDSREKTFLGNRYQSLPILNGISLAMQDLIVKGIAAESGDKFEPSHPRDFDEQKKAIDYFVIARNLYPNLMNGFVLSMRPNFSIEKIAEQLAINDLVRNPNSVIDWWRKNNQDYIRHNKKLKRGMVLYGQGAYETTFTVKEITEENGEQEMIIKKTKFEEKVPNFELLYKPDFY